MTISGTNKERTRTGLTLADALSGLLKAEDEAAVVRAGAEHEGKEILRRVRENFAQEQETRLKAARAEAAEQLESARTSAEREALHISELANKAHESMKAHFDERAPSIIKKITEEVALRYAARGGR